MNKKPTPLKQTMNSIKTNNFRVAQIEDENVKSNITTGHTDTTVYGCRALETFRNYRQQNTTALGAHTLQYNRDGHVTAVGAYAGLGCIKGKKSTIIGEETQLYTDGYKNTSIGFRAMAGSCSGDEPEEEPMCNHNTAVGADAMCDILSGSNNNTSVGSESLQNVNGSCNTCVGSTTGNTVTEGSYNTFIGCGADTNNNTSLYRTAIGAGAIVGQDNSIIIGRINDVVGIRSTVPDAVLHVTDGADNTVNSVVHVHTEGSPDALYSVATGTGVALKTEGGHKYKVTKVIPNGPGFTYTANMNDHVIVVTSTSLSTNDTSIIILPTPTINNNGHIFIIKNAIVTNSVYVRTTPISVVFCPIGNDDSPSGLVNEVSLLTGTRRSFILLDLIYYEI